MARTTTYAHAASGAPGVAIYATRLCKGERKELHPALRHPPETLRHEHHLQITKTFPGCETHLQPSPDTKARPW